MQSNQGTKHEIEGRNHLAHGRSSQLYLSKWSGSAG